MTKALILELSPELTATPEQLARDEQVLHDQFAELAAQDMDEAGIEDLYRYKLFEAHEAIREGIAKVLTLRRTLALRKKGQEVANGQCDSLLLSIIQRRNPDQAIGAANAMTLLVAMGHRFEDDDLHGACLQGAIMEPESSPQIQNFAVQYPSSTPETASTSAA